MPTQSSLLSQENRGICAEGGRLCQHTPSLPAPLRSGSPGLVAGNQGLTEPGPSAVPTLSDPECPQRHSCPDSIQGSRTERHSGMGARVCMARYYCSWRPGKSISSGSSVPPQPLKSVLIHF